MLDIKSFTLKQWLEHLDSFDTEIRYEDALRLHEEIVLRGWYEPIAITDEGDWVYRYVPPMERIRAQMYVIPLPKKDVL